MLNYFITAWLFSVQLWWFYSQLLCIYGEHTNSAYAGLICVSIMASIFLFVPSLLLMYVNYLLLEVILRKRFLVKHSDHLKADIKKNNLTKIPICQQNSKFEKYFIFTKRTCENKCHRSLQLYVTVRLYFLNFVWKKSMFLITALYKRYSVITEHGYHLNKYRNFVQRIHYIIYQNEE